MYFAGRDGVEGLFQVDDKVLVEEFDTGDEEVVAVAEMDGVDEGENLVAVGAEGFHFVFEPFVVDECRAQLVGVLHFDQEVGDVVLFNEREALLEGFHLFGTDVEVVAGVVFAFEFFGLDFDVAAGDVFSTLEHAVLFEGLEPVLYPLVVETVEPCVDDLHVAGVECHFCGFPVDGGVDEEVDGTFYAVVFHDVGVDFEDDEAGVDAVEIGLEEDKSLDGSLVGGAQVETTDVVGTIETGVEGAVAMG